MVVVASEGALISAHRPWLPNITNGISLYSDRWMDYAAIYKTQPNVRLVVGFLSRNIAQLGIKAFRAVSDAERQPVDRSHPLSRLLRRPNPFTTKHRFVDSLVHDRKVYDDFFALIAKNPQTGQPNLFRIPPPMIMPADGENWIQPAAWKLLGSRAQPEFPANQILHLRGYNPADSRIGLSPIESLRRMLAEEAAAGEWREQYWRGAARISGVIQRPLEAPDWSPTARSRFRAEWQATWAGNAELAAATPVLEDGMIWKDASFSPKDSEYILARRLGREEAAAMFYVSPVFVGILDHANFSNMTEQHKGLYQDTLGPDLDEYEEDFGLQLLPYFADLDPDEVYFEFNLAEKLKGSFEEQATSLRTAVGAPWLTRNEARARQNLPPADGGDQLVTPLNVLVGGQASPRDTAPAPGAASRRKNRKAADDLPAVVQGWHAKHVEILGGFFDRQAATITSRLGAGWSVGEAWDEQRWNDELTVDLTALATTMTGEVAAAEADQWGVTYDTARAEAWLQENARIAAEGINSVTRDGVVAAMHHGGVASRRKDVPVAEADPEQEPADPLAPVFALFAIAASTRADQIAVTRVTTVGNFARHDAAEQAGVPYKMWVVNSGRSRHPEMNGQAVVLGELFSNGGRWPGDPALGADQTAGCTCSLSFTTEAS